MYILEHTIFLVWIRSTRLSGATMSRQKELYFARFEWIKSEFNSVSSRLQNTKYFSLMKTNVERQFKKTSKLFNIRSY